MLAPDKQWDVVVAGDLFMDTVMTGFHQLPRLGEEAFARTMQQEIGGGAAITSCGLARLGLQVAVLGVAGKEDGMGIYKKLTGAGVNASALEYHPTEPSGVTVSVSTAQDRAFFTYYGANESLPMLLQQPEARRLMANARHVHFACAPHPMSDAGLLPQLHNAGCTISIDVGWHEHWLSDRRNYDILRDADLFLPNEREAMLMTGRSHPEHMLETLTRNGVRNIALKLGERGAALSWRGQLTCCPPYSVEPIDTTGAGDCFDAGFLYAWLNGEEPEYCLRAACVCGALSTRGLGGIATFPFKEELEAALDTVRS